VDSELNCGLLGVSEGEALFIQRVSLAKTEVDDLFLEDEVGVGGAALDAEDLRGGVVERGQKICCFRRRCQIQKMERYGDNFLAIGFENSFTLSDIGRESWILFNSLYFEASGNGGAIHKCDAFPYWAVLIDWLDYLPMDGENLEI
jgi:hypothetical protein